MSKKDDPKYETIVLSDGTQARHYFKDNSIRNERGHMIEPLESPHKITPDNARDHALKRVQLKRAAIARAANEAINDNTITTKYGDLGYIAAIAHAAMIKAMNASDPKQIDAARFLIKETGLSENPTQNLDNSSTNSDSILQNLGESVINAIINRVKKG